MTPRERRILACIAHGQTDPEIARRMHLSNYTIKNTVVGIRDKLGARTRSHAVAIALSDGTLNPLDPSGLKEQLLPP